MSLNINKCFSMSFYRSREHIYFTYSIKNNELNLVSYIRDLTLTHNLNFQEHIIECIVKKSLCLLELNKQLLLSLIIFKENPVGSQTKKQI